MLWNEFLPLLKAAKKAEAGQLNLDAGSLTAMLFSGQMDSMFTTPPSAEEYFEYAEELKKAINSKAKAKEASKTEEYGIADITSATLLHLWRNQANPIYQFDWFSILDSKIRQLAKFIPTKNNPLIPYVRYNQTQTQRTDIWKSWQSLEDHPKALSSYLVEGSGRFPAFVGVIVDQKIFSYREDTKNALKIKLYTGIDETEYITVWPPRGQNKITPQIKGRMAIGTVGIAALAVKMWNNRLSPALDEWVVLDKPEKKKSGS